MRTATVPPCYPLNNNNSGGGGGATFFPRYVAGRGLNPASAGRLAPSHVPSRWHKRAGGVDGGLCDFRLALAGVPGKKIAAWGLKGSPSQEEEWVYG